MNTRCIDVQIISNVICFNLLFDSYIIKYNFYIIKYPIIKDVNKLLFVSKETTKQPVLSFGFYFFRLCWQVF